MNNEIKIFNHAQFGQIRTMTMPNGQIGFVGKDVAEVLGYNQTDKAINRHVDEDDRMKCTVIDSLGRNQMAYIITESGLYSLILASKLPQAREFKHWVTSEVLPQIRQTGGYIPVAEEDDEKTILCKAVGILMRTVEMQKQSLAQSEQQIARLLPKAEYAEAVLLSPRCYTMTEVAKSLSLTVNELQHLLHDKGIIYRAPSGIWMLYADHLKQGYEAYRTKKGENLFGETVWTDTYLVWTEKGKEFITRTLGRDSLPALSPKGICFAAPVGRGPVTFA